MSSFPKSYKEGFEQKMKDMTKAEEAKRELLKPLVSEDTLTRWADKIEMIEKNKEEVYGTVTGVTYSGRALSDKELITATASKRITTMPIAPTFMWEGTEIKPSVPPATFVGEVTIEKIQELVASTFYEGHSGETNLQMFAQKLLSNIGVVYKDSAYYLVLL